MYEIFGETMDLHIPEPIVSSGAHLEAEGNALSVFIGAAAMPQAQMLLAVRNAL